MNARHLFASAVAALASSLATAAPVIIDGANHASYAADCTFACLSSYQQAYSHTLFNGIVNISDIDFRYTNSGQSWSAGNQYRLTIGIANGGVNNLSGNQASNFKSSQVFEIKSFTGATTADAWYGFDGSFVYDSSLGDLLISIERIAGNASSINTYYNSNSGGQFSRTYAGDYFGSPSNANVDNNYGNVTRFDTAAATVPEPASLALVALSLAGVGLVRRMRVAR